jgi:hypothetical protein
MGKTMLFYIGKKGYETLSFARLLTACFTFTSPVKPEAISSSETSINF